MSHQMEIAARLAAVEREVLVLKQMLQGDGDWVDALSGTFADDPEWDEVYRLGKEIRDAEQADFEEEAR
jgi:hypothetical protein